jgi:hypothetical protein
MPHYKRTHRHGFAQPEGKWAFWWALFGGRPFIRASCPDQIPRGPHSMRRSHHGSLRLTVASGNNCFARWNSSSGADVPKRMCAMALSPIARRTQGMVDCESAGRDENVESASRRCLTTPALSASHIPPQANNAQTVNAANIVCRPKCSKRGLDASISAPVLIGDIPLAAHPTAHKKPRSQI